MSVYELRSDNIGTDYFEVQCWLEKATAGDTIPCNILNNKMYPVPTHTVYAISVS